MFFDPFNSFPSKPVAPHRDSPVSVLSHRNSDTRRKTLRGSSECRPSPAVLATKQEEAFTNKDAAAVAALFTEDAVLVAPDGIFSGKQAIEKRYEDTFQRWPFTQFNDPRDCHLDAIDNAVWSYGEWRGTLQGEAGPAFVKGYFSAIYVREGDDWKMRILTLTEHPRPAPPAETK